MQIHEIDLQDLLLFELLLQSRSLDQIVILPVPELKRSEVLPSVIPEVMDGRSPLGPGGIGGFVA